MAVALPLLLAQPWVPRNVGLYQLLFLFFFVSLKIPTNAKKMRWVLIWSVIMFHEVATLVHLIELSKPAAHA